MIAHRHYLTQEDNNTRLAKIICRLPLLWHVNCLCFITFAQWRDLKQYMCNHIISLSLHILVAPFLILWLIYLVQTCSSSSSSSRIAWCYEQATQLKIIINVCGVSLFLSCFSCCYDKGNNYYYYLFYLLPFVNYIVVKTTQKNDQLNILLYFLFPRSKKTYHASQFFRQTNTEKCKIYWKKR